MERRNQIKKAIKDNRLLLGVLAGVIGGCIIGIASHEAVQSSSNPSPKRLAMYIKFPGELFNRMLKMMLIPLITSSVIVALAEIELSSAGRLGKRTMIYYVTTTVLSAKIGLILAAIIKPGSEVNEKNEASKNIHRNSMDSFLDLLRYYSEYLSFYFTKYNSFNIKSFLRVWVNIYLGGKVFSSYI